ncbi:RNA polymerase sigma factor (sigma-70 family) [Actinoplanes octamycinicus]|uniref:RNA polymerase sigma factor (Sigma-70 family) n=1 Tax=Actinoplanes octamycinicus TaxID=135948 RepID=A0A7W7H3V7_9ACTN|nr:sigma-70 family RNA polymerase sigma factor [Actinoplanes octamycinicus]MBB4743525.1 RNA polymerase sigma factor (sigma-70 family) [Actinoplanes octamycinicus]GIE62489.1 RNA polymerase sigma24 factor [Actinoplanes octamycinicus]
MLELLDPPVPAPARAPASTEQFTRFASDSSARLHSTAFQLCRDWHLAQDLTQATLTKLFLSWERAAGSDNLSAYAQKVLVRTYLDHRRRRSSTESTPGELREPSYAVDRDLRITMMDALSRLPARDRTIVLLRYFADHSVEQVAAELDVPITVVKSQTRRSLIKLKHLLLRDRATLFVA